MRRDDKAVLLKAARVRREYAEKTRRSVGECFLVSEERSSLGLHFEVRRNKSFEI